MKSMKINILTILLMVTVITANVWGAIGSWHNYTYSDDSRDIASDGERIWCATSGGLVYYDTQTEELGKLLNSDGLGDINILCLEVDTAGNIFAGGANSTLTRIGPDGDMQVEVFEIGNDVRYQIFDLFADGEVLWVGTEVGVSKYLIYNNGGEFQETYDHLGDLPDRMQVKAVLATEYYIWAGTDSGLAYIEKDNPLPQNPENWNTITRDENGLTNPYIKALVAVGDTLMVATAEGVFWMDTDSLWHNIGPITGTVFALQYLDGVLTAATNSGIYRRINGVWQHVISDSLINDDARGITVDDQGNIWGVFAKGALARYDELYWSVYSVPGPPSNRIQKIALDSTGNAWLVHAQQGHSSPAGVSKFSNDEWFYYTTRNSGIKGNGADAVKYDRFRDLIWFGSWGDGVFSFDGDTTWVNYNETNSPLRGVTGFPYYVPIPSINIDNDGNIWMLNLGARNPNLVMVAFDPDDSVWQGYYENTQQVPDNYQFVLYIHGDTVYVAGELPNIERLEFNEATDSSDDNWLTTFTGVEQVHDLLVDNYGKLFAATASGLFYYDLSSPQVASLELPDGYRSSVNCITMDGLGNKWVGTDSGVVVLSSRIDPYASTDSLWKEKFKKSNSYLLDNSVLSIEIDRNNGLVYMGTLQGLSIYESGNIAPSPNLEDMAVYPNPVDGKPQDARVNFLKVPTDAEIYIYTVAGDLVKKFSYESSTSWDLRNEDGRKVAAGIYIFYVKSGSNSGTGKFAVIR